jgi:predicted phage terminase large subunit-like protein
MANLGWIANNPKNALIAIDRALVETGGLHAFTKLAWNIIEAPGTFVDNWHIQVMCHELEEITKGNNNRLLLAVPPRHMKSSTAAVFWPAYDWIYNPWRRFLYASHSMSLSIRDSVKTRRLIESDWFQERWGDRFKIIGDQNTKSKFDTDKTGGREVTSVESKVTGKGGDIIVVDDPIDADDANSETIRNGVLRWWNEAMPTRLNDQRKSAFVVIHQRTHAQDLIGDIIQRHGITQNGGRYKMVCFPGEFDPNHPYISEYDPRTEPGELLWPAKLPRAEYDVLKESLGLYGAAAQLQQLPTPREGGLFKADWFIRCTEADLPTDMLFVRAWDFAYSEQQIVKADPDYAATVKMGYSPSTRKWYILHADHFRAPPHVVDQRMLSFARDVDGRDCVIRFPIEPAAAGQRQAKHHAALLGEFSIYYDVIRGSKTARSTPFAGQAGIGNIYILRGAWNEMFITEMTVFPNGSHDDMVDAATDAYDYLANHRPGIIEYYQQMNKTAVANKPADPEPGLHVDDVADMGKAFTTGGWLISKE